jgi:hypothetical protein
MEHIIGELVLETSDDNESTVTMDSWLAEDNVSTLTMDSWLAEEADNIKYILSIVKVLMR